MVFPVEHSGPALASHRLCTALEMHKGRANTREMLESPWNKHPENPGNSSLPRLATVLPFLLLSSPMQCPQQPPALLLEMLWGALSISKPQKFPLNGKMSAVPVPSNAGSQGGQEEPWEEMRWHLQGIVGGTFISVGKWEGLEVEMCQEMHL